MSSRCRLPPDVEGALAGRAAAAADAAAGANEATSDGGLELGGGRQEAGPPQAGARRDELRAAEPRERRPAAGGRQGQAQPRRRAAAASRTGAGEPRAARRGFGSGGLLSRTGAGVFFSGELMGWAARRYGLRQTQPH